VARIRDRLAPSRTLGALTDDGAVLAAIAEFDELGEVQFLKQYGFDRARSYLLVYEGRTYPSKAIAGVAFGKQFPGSGPLLHHEFAGGRHAAAAALERLGFEVHPTHLRGELVRPVQDGQRGARTVDNIGLPGGEIPIPSPPRAPTPPEVDPDTQGRGVVVHEQTRNGLATHLAAHGIRWRRPARGEPEFDLGWRIDTVFYVCETKSLMGESEVAQLRRGLGQVLEYRHRIVSMITSGEVVAVLAVSREPLDKTWVEICASVGLLLVWPPWGRVPTQ